MLGGRTRAALEREKTLVLRAIKELEFDRAMGKVSEADWQEMTGRLRARAVRLIRQLDSGSAVYRDLIEKELSAREASAGSRAAGEPQRVRQPASLALLALVAGSLARRRPCERADGRAWAGGGGMPDAKAMSGIARPSETVPTGSVSVRLVRGQISNLVTGHPVEFSVDGKRQTVKTDATGHAVLAGLGAGAAVQAFGDGGRRAARVAGVPGAGPGRRRADAGRQRQDCAAADGEGRRAGHRGARQPVAGHRAVRRRSAAGLLPARHRERKRRSREDSGAAGLRDAGRRAEHVASSKARRPRRRRRVRA